jgi:uncharacterized membrane protein YgdD (TMEM256/DUF423 family)
VGALSAFLSVVIGAFSAHVLRGQMAADMLEVIQLGARYQMFHALALLGVGWAHARTPRNASLAGWLFTIGTVLFAGSLYVLAFTSNDAWGAVTPLGGLCFLVGWLVLALGLWNAPPR